eukprot:TRINITY_DN5482_c1_g1_i2.p1 TRINITY_DN5482_c1_g1~~TRINITY_DN5482_c1_g1_i2.p1  ORF type:complete len:491 (-),score=53.87 TRINITY_DN5482_c1_g1_i2:382-1686(-)
MSNEIESVRLNARYIFNQLTCQTSHNIRFGIGAYKDFGDDFVFKNILNLTLFNPSIPKEEDPIIQGMGEWKAEGGLDEEEAFLYAFLMIIREEYDTIGWNDNAQKIIVWIGDAPGHNFSRTTQRETITEEMVTQQLVQREIQVSAIDVQNMDSFGQVTRIVNATRGQLTTLRREALVGNTQTQSPLPTTIAENCEAPKRSKRKYYQSPPLSLQVAPSTEDKFVNGQDLQPSSPLSVPSVEYMSPSLPMSIIPVDEDQIYNDQDLQYVPNVEYVSPSPMSSPRPLTIDPKFTNPLFKTFKTQTDPKVINPRITRMKVLDSDPKIINPKFRSHPQDILGDPKIINPRFRIPYPEDIQNDTQIIDDSFDGAETLNDLTGSGSEIINPESENIINSSEQVPGSLNTSNTTEPPSISNERFTFVEAVVDNIVRVINSNE